MNAILTDRDTATTPTQPRLADFVRSPGGVWQSPYAKPFNYSDGDATEERIYRIVADARDKSVYSGELVGKINDWPSEYHFSPRRANLIRLLALDAQHSVLELGCGCGAVTKALAETGCRVSAIEGSPRRARVAAARVREHDRARVYHSNFQDVAMEPVHDLVTLIGVLEYSPVYLDAEDPFVAGLEIAMSALKPGGTLLLAIENRMGLKYFAGISEDHFNQPYYGIEGRYGKKETTTYGRVGLERKLRAAGFGGVSFYFPFPDYKLPEAVIAERALEHSGFRADDLLHGMEHRDYCGPGKASFNLDMALQSVHEEGLLGAMANSFLVLATREGPPALVEPALLAQKYTDIRRPGLNVVTSFIEDGQGINVVKTPIGTSPQPSMAVEHVFTSERYQAGRNLHTLLKRAAIAGRGEDVRALLRRWAGILQEAADTDGELPGEWMDAIPSNLIVHEDGSASLIDREWRMPHPVAVSLPFYRGLQLLLADSAFRPLFPKGDATVGARWMCEQAGWAFDAEAFKQALDTTNALWRDVFDNNQWGRADRYRLRQRNNTIQIKPRVLGYADIVAGRTPSQTRLLELVKAVRPTASKLIGYVVMATGGDTAALAHTLDSIVAMGYPAHEVCVIGDVALPDRHTDVSQVKAGAVEVREALNRFLARSQAEWVQLMAAGDTLSPLFAALLDEKLANDLNLAAVYTDEDSTSDGAPAAPVLKPDVNLDLMRSYPYVGHALAFRRDYALAVGGFAEEPSELGAQDLLLRLLERYGLHTIGHIAEPVLSAGQPYTEWLATPAVTARCAAVVSAHLDRLRIAHEIQSGGVPGVNRVRYLHDREPPVSIIIPTRDQMPMLNGLIESLLAKTRYKNYELLIVDNDSRDPAACAYLDGIERMQNPQLRVLRWPHPFNYSAINNFAAGEARGEYLILLNNDTAILHEDWIEALLNHAQRPEVGIVGAKLHYPDGRIQHAGVVLGLRGPADHPFIGGAMDAAGYMQRLQVDQNYTAVTAACLMIRKSVYDEVGGLDEQDFKVSYNDVDLCLKVRAAGYLSVWTPYARVMHEGSVSQTKVDKTAQEAKGKRFKGEQQAMYRKWLPLLADDPAYNRNLGLTGSGFDLDQTRHMAWQPFEQPLLPRMFCVAADAGGCGQYRIRQPLLAMQREGIAEGLLAPAHLTPVLMERFLPSSIVLQRQLDAKQLAAMHDYRDFSRAFKVYELDDYLPNLPLKSVHRDQMPRDILRTLRKAVALTDRFVVSTEPLAEQFAGFHGDIRVVLNRLPVDWWGSLSSERRQSPKPRVGWAGGSGHRGDLELIVDVVRDLADEVEWIFFGLCPDKLRPYVHEVHDGVPIGEYPAALAALNLDLALAPLEDNTFNACKSNLRLLEYGACGFPVVCSDIVCYRGDLPVTRVRNRYRDWVDAIRMHLADLDATGKAGDRLREAVHRDWMLTGDNLAAWLGAWLPG
ncbi:MAG TPA: glycosyltransferase [Rhodanobacteraceae bacterium]|nr:glycosyltransferase [Rhodanobacteraceae bacterium]